MAIFKQLFNKLIPKEVRFGRGEDISQTKLNGAFKQIENAFFMLESFIGNGLDFFAEENNDRKMLFNISSSIGRSDKIYKPINKLISLSLIPKKYGAGISTYLDGELTLTSDVTNLTLPTEGKNGYEFGIYYKGRGKVLGLDGTQNWITLPDKGSSYGWHYLNVTADIAYIRLVKYNVGTDFKIKSIYISEKINNAIYNIAYSIPLGNNVYYTVKTPCKWSNIELDPSNVNNTSSIRCGSRTCKYCIGNTINLDDTDSINYGKPICSGALAEDGITQRSYLSDDDNVRKDYLTIQSPALTIDRQYSNRYKSFYLNSEVVDTEIPQNYLVLYDLKNSASPIKYHIKLHSSGRSDILYIKNANDIISGDSKRYIVLGGNYGLSDMLSDILFMTELPIPLSAIEPDVAIYA